MPPLVSVIMPSYNSERYIAEAISSVQAQTLTNWELLVSDDCSTDSTREIVSAISRDDPRICLLPLQGNGGAAKARNNSLSHVRGRYVAYLDSDDLWYPEKLERQVAFMKEHEAAFSCCSYEVIGENDTPLGRTVHMLNKSDYKGFLLNNLIQTVGVMVDLDKVDKELLRMPSLHRCEDAATWLQLLKAGYDCYGIYDVMCGYRRVKGSLSSGKLDGARSIWFLYRGIEKLNFPLSVVCFVRYTVFAVWKRFYSDASRKGQDFK